MTFADFKALLEMKRKGDVKLPTKNEELKPLIQESLEYVAKTIIPKTLVTEDSQYEVLRQLNLTEFVRVPIAPTLDTDTIDIDSTLVYAVAYDLLSNLTSDIMKAQFFTSKRDDEIGLVQWNNYKYNQELENEDA